MNIRGFQKELRAVSPWLSLVQAKDYLYFIYDDKTCFETKSVYVPRFACLTPAQWLAEAKGFLAQVQ